MQVRYPCPEKSKSLSRASQHLYCIKICKYQINQSQIAVLQALLSLVESSLNRELCVKLLRFLLEE